MLPFCVTVILLHSPNPQESLRAPAALFFITMHPKLAERQKDNEMEHGHKDRLIHEVGEDGESRDTLQFVYQQAIRVYSIFLGGCVIYFYH